MFLSYKKTDGGKNTTIFGVGRAKQPGATRVHMEDVTLLFAPVLQEHTAGRLVTRAQMNGAVNCAYSGSLVPLSMPVCAKRGHAGIIFSGRRHYSAHCDTVTQSYMCREVLPALYRDAGIVEGTPSVL